MQPFTNKFWLQTLAAELPQINIAEDQHHLQPTHQQGLMISINSHLQRLIFGIINLQALNTSLICPIKPPPPITVDHRRAIVRIANELQRRLITPGLTWYETALLWQQEDNEAYTAQRLTINAFVDAGGHPHRDYSTHIDGHRWHAQINSADSVTHLTSLPPEKALAIVQLLTT
jgi:hypothetical protein